MKRVEYLYVAPDGSLEIWWKYRDLRNYVWAVECDLGCGFFFIRSPEELGSIKIDRWEIE